MALINIACFAKQTWSAHQGHGGGIFWCWEWVSGCGNPMWFCQASSKPVPVSAIAVTAVTNCGTDKKCWACSRNCSHSLSACKKIWHLQHQTSCNHQTSNVCWWWLSDVWCLMSDDDMEQQPMHLHIIKGASVTRSGPDCTMTTRLSLHHKLLKLWQGIHWVFRWQQ